MPDTKHNIRQYKLEHGALEVQYIEDYFQEFKKRMTAEDIISRLAGREHLILLSMAPIPDEDEEDRVIPVAFKVGHELRRDEKDPQLARVVEELSEWLDFSRGKIFFSWIGGTRGPWRGQGHYRALTEQQEEWAHAQGYREIIVKTKNKYYDMWGTLAHLRFDVVNFRRHPADIGESRIYLSKRISPETLLDHQTLRSVAEVV
jgi:GNAT superfamily N-acetyltransferase